MINESSTASLLLGIERDLRHAQSVAVLRFYLVCEIRRLISYQQAILFRRSGGSLKIEAVSNVATLDRNAPYMVFLERALAQFDKAGTLSGAATLKAQQLAAAEQAEWHEFLAENAYWQPLVTAKGDELGGLMFVRGESWNASEFALLEEIADAAAHAWAALEHPHLRRGKFSRLRRRPVAVGITVAVLALLFIPVRLSAIAPAEVVPKNPAIIAAPINGVIKEVHIKPNAMAVHDEVLFSYEDAELRANHNIALRAVDEAEAELHRASQQAFGDPKGRAEVSLLKKRLALRHEQADYSAYQLSQVEVIAPVEGIAIFNDPNQWRGRPVSTGERVMAIADPTAAELAIYIPVADAIQLQPDTAVKLFLDVQPLDPIDARLVLAAYQPIAMPDGVLAYRAVADFSDGMELPRIGLKGSAKVLGERVPLALFLFRRPLVALRQMVGF